MGGLDPSPTSLADFHEPLEVLPRGLGSRQTLKREESGGGQMEVEAEVENKLTLCFLLALRSKKYLPVSRSPGHA